MATSYTLTNLDSKLKNYLSANKDQLISNAIFNSKSSKLFTLQTGVKNPTAIVRLDTSINLADGKACGFSATDADVFSNRILTPEFLKLNKQYCAKDFLNTWKASDIRMAATSENGGMPFEEEIINKNIEALGAVVEKMLWQGDKTNGSGNMALMDGLTTIMSSEITSGAIPAANVIAKSTDNVYTRVEKLWKALPANIADKCTIVMSVSNYKDLIVELANSNYFHIFETYEGEYRMRLPFANIDVRGIEGLEGMDWIIAMPLDEVYYGVDAENDQEDVDLFYDQAARLFKLVIEFAVAVNYVFPENVFINK